MTKTRNLKKYRKRTIRRKSKLSRMGRFPRKRQSRRVSRRNKRRNITVRVRRRG